MVQFLGLNEPSRLRVSGSLGTVQLVAGTTAQVLETPQPRDQLLSQGKERYVCTPFVHSWSLS